MKNLFEKKIEKFTWKSPSKIGKMLKNDKSEERNNFKRKYLIFFGKKLEEFFEK
jgi:hypothetical protein